MSSRRLVTACLEWWVEPVPQWSKVAGLPVAAALLTFLVWGLVAGDGAPPWLEDAAIAIVLWGLMPIMLGGWIHSFVRVYRRTGQSTA